TAVTDDALVQCIKEIRQSLGDDSRQPRLIKTVPKIGYRFIGPVEELCLDQPVVAAAVERKEVTTFEIEYEEEGSEEETGRLDDGATGRKEITRGSLPVSLSPSRPIS